jgi:hypothetical protein
MIEHLEGSLFPQSLNYSSTALPSHSKPFVQNILPKNHHNHYTPVPNTTPPEVLLIWRNSPNITPTPKAMCTTYRITYTCPNPYCTYSLMTWGIYCYYVFGRNCRRRSECMYGACGHIDYGGVQRMAYACPTCRGIRRGDEYCGR